MSHALGHTHRRSPSALWGAGVLGALLTLQAPIALAQTDPARPSAQARAPEFRLSGDTVVLPLVMVREFPFIQGSIAGVSGQLMLDTGALDALVVNDHRVPVREAEIVGTGLFGSGQTFARQMVPAIEDVRFGPLAIDRVTTVQTQDGQMLEQRITSDFLGWFGYHAFDGYALEIDYRRLEATFHRHGASDYLTGEQVVAELPFTLRRLPNIPFMQGRVANLDLTVLWDTGQNGGLYTTEAGKAELLASGRLTPSSGRPEAFDLHDMQVGGTTFAVLPAISVQTEPSPAATPLGLTEGHHLMLGYTVLSQFKSVWDYERQRIYLLSY